MEGTFDHSGSGELREGAFNRGFVPNQGAFFASDEECSWASAAKQAAWASAAKQAAWASAAKQAALRAMVSVFCERYREFFLRAKSWTVFFPFPICSLKLSSIYFYFANR